MKAGTWYRWNTVKTIRYYFTLTFYWSIAMFNNYFKVAFRNLRKYKGYSFINISGLAVGIACFILIILWVQDELGFDKFHKKHKNI